MGSGSWSGYMVRGRGYGLRGTGYGGRWGYGVGVGVGPETSSVVCLRHG